MREGIGRRILTRSRGDCGEERAESTPQSSQWRGTLCRDQGLHVAEQRRKFLMLSISARRKQLASGGMLEACGLKSDISNSRSIEPQGGHDKACSSKRRL